MFHGFFFFFYISRYGRNTVFYLFIAKRREDYRQLTKFVLIFFLPFDILLLVLNTFASIFYLKMKHLFPILFTKICFLKPFFKKAKQLYIFYFEMDRNEHIWCYFISKSSLFWCYFDENYFRGKLKKPTIFSAALATKATWFQKVLHFVLLIWKLSLWLL